MEEVVVSCSTDGITAWQLRSGAVLQSYKNNNSLTFTKCGQHLLAPQTNRSYLQSYNWNKEQVCWNAPIPEKLISVACSEDGKYVCGGGSKGMMYLWEINGGTLIAQWQGHFNEVLCMGFYRNTMIITGGKDSMIHCWLLKSLFKQGVEITPYKSFSSHSLPVTSLFCSFSRILSSSSDHTCKLWSVASNDPLCSIVFPSAITHATMNTMETAIYAGSNEGKIYCAETLVSDSYPSDKVFIGHTKLISAVSVTVDGTILVSSSLDNTVKLWDTKSGQLVRNFNHHKGPVTFSALYVIPRCLFEDNIQKLFIQPFSMAKKYGNSPYDATYTVPLPTSSSPSLFNSSSSSQLHPSSYSENSLQSTDETAQERLQQMEAKIESLETQVVRWQTVSNQLYEMQIDRIV